MDEKKVNEQENSDIDHYQVTLNTIVHPEIFNRIVKMVKTGEKYSDSNTLFKGKPSKIKSAFDQSPLKLPR